MTCTGILTISSYTSKKAAGPSRPVRIIAGPVKALTKEERKVRIFKDIAVPTGSQDPNEYRYLRRI